MSTRSRGRGREDSHTQGRELREGERTPGAHLGAHEVYDGVEALAGARLFAESVSQVLLGMKV